MGLYQGKVGFLVLSLDYGAV